MWFVAETWAVFALSDGDAVDDRLRHSAVTHIQTVLGFRPPESKVHITTQTA